MRRLIALAFLVNTAACASTARSPRDRYIDAINHGLEGNSAAELDDLIALAYEAPETRAGRRARATLGGSDVLTATWAMGLIAAVAVPNFVKFQNRAKQTEAKSQLEATFKAMASHHAKRGRYCRTFAECGVAFAPNSRYVYVMRVKRLAQGVVPLEAAGGGTAELFDSLGELARRGLAPEVRADGFRIVAIANLDSDSGLDIWSIDQDGNLEHISDDVP